MEVSQEIAEDKLLHVIEELELNGVASVFYGHNKTRHRGLICRVVSMELPQSNVFRKIPKIFKDLRIGTMRQTHHSYNSHET
jgi:hypothetical protein